MDSGGLVSVEGPSTLSEATSATEGSWCDED
jgi:hypothetical protein